MRPSTISKNYQNGFLYQSLKIVTREAQKNIVQATLYNCSMEYLISSIHISLRLFLIL